MKTEKHIISITAEEQIISLTDDLHDAYDTIRGLERELEKCQMSDKSDTKSTERPTYKTGLRTVMYAGRLNERVGELEREVEEQARLNGMGSEREARLMANVTELKRENAALKSALDAQMKYQKELRTDRDRIDWLNTQTGSEWAFNETNQGTITRRGIDEAMEIIT